MSVNGEVADDGGEEATSDEIEERIENFKQKKLDRNHPLLG